MELNERLRELRKEQGETQKPVSYTHLLCLCAVFGLAWLAVHLFQAG